MDPESMPATLASRGTDKMTERSSQLGFREGISLIILTTELGPWDAVGKIPAFILGLPVSQFSERICWNLVT